MAKKHNRTLRVALAQLNLCVGDVAGNLQKAREALQEARSGQADVILFPELTLSSYAPEDLVFRPDFLAQMQAGLRALAEQATGITAVVGLPLPAGNGAVHNAACVLQDGGCVGTYAKQELPNYRVFDEKRWFVAGQDSLVVEIAGVRCGVVVCEDIWHEAPARRCVEAGAELLLVPNASPYRSDKPEERHKLLVEQARRNCCPIAYTNLVGGQDELVFDGDSMLVSREGVRVFSAPLLEAGVFIGELSPDPVPVAQQTEHHPAAAVTREQHVYQALVLGTRDYVHKNGFRGVLLGLSGGIDSALTLTIAVDALGAENVHAVMMPFRYTAQMSVEDARQQAEVLGVRFDIIPIEPVFAGFTQALEPVFTGLAADVTEENLQARIRGMLLMSMSNKFGKLLLSTSNKSESAVGYTTLYGDMCGAYAPLKDVYKTLVYRLARYRNSLGSEVVPVRVIERPPSAELAPGQLDQDSLPSYEVLDAILECFIERDMALEAIVAAGFDRATVQRVVNLVLLNEYKRRQAPPGTRITARAFGRDWRYPVTSRWRKFLPFKES
ncbi:MAG TPA: NAD+ synthase [Thiolinea sp.]|nr:NAD+ synthase [Thiolinea sp.]